MEIANLIGRLPRLDLTSAVQAERSHGSKRVAEIEPTSLADTLITTSLIIDPKILGETPAFLHKIYLHNV